MRVIVLIMAALTAITVYALYEVTETLTINTPLSVLPDAIVGAFASCVALTALLTR